MLNTRWTNTTYAKGWPSVPYAEGGWAGVEEGNPHFIKNLGLKLTITHAIAKETGSKGRRRSSTNLIAQNLMHFGFKIRL